MRVISRKRLLEFSRRHPDARPSLDDWYHKVRRANWRHIQDVRTVFNDADAGIRVGSGRKVTVFNVGDGYRPVAAIHYNVRRVFVREVLTHADYERGAWKERN